MREERAAAAGPTESYERFWNHISTGGTDLAGKALL